MLRMLFAALILLSTSIANAAPLTDRQAKALIEKQFTDNVIDLPVGKIEVRGDTQDLPKSVLPRFVYCRAMAAASLGLVTVSELPTPSGPLGVPLVAPNVFHKIILIRPSEKALSESIWSRTKMWGLPNDGLAFRLGTFTIDRIVKNEPLNRGGEEYAIVFLSFRANWNPLFLKLNEAQQNICNNLFNMPKASAPAKERKGRIVFQRNAFKDEWVIVSSDFANLDEEFESYNVPLHLKALGN